MAKLSRRSLLFGGFIKDALPERSDEKTSALVTDLLARSRNRAPWERTRESDGATGQIARVLTFDCLITLGSSCTSCLERCPEPGALISGGNRAPRIDPNACTGCGDCVVACPAPKTAIALGPRQ